MPRPCDIMQKGSCWNFETLAATLNQGPGCTHRRTLVLRRVPLATRVALAASLRKVSVERLPRVRDNRVVMALPKLKSAPRKKRKGRARRKKT